METAKTLGDNDCNCCDFNNCLKNVIYWQFKFSSILAGPSALLANVSGYSTSSTSIFVMWDQVPAEYQSGAMLYYIISYRALPSGSVQTKNVTANQTTLTGLNKYTNYSITVFAFTIKGVGNVNVPIFIVTDEDSKLQDL